MRRLNLLQLLWVWIALGEAAVMISTGGHRLVYGTLLLLLSAGGVALWLALSNRDWMTLAAQCRELDFRLEVARAEQQHAQALLQDISQATIGDTAALLGASDALASIHPLPSPAMTLEQVSPNGATIEQVLRDPMVARLISDGCHDEFQTKNRVFEQDIQTPAGRRRVRVALCPAPQVRGEKADASMGGVVVVLHDVTRENEITELKNQFVSMVSHELRTPLASIKAYIEMLIDGEAIDQRATSEFYEVIQAESNRLGQLIDNMLSRSRIEADIVKVRQEPHRLDDVIREALDVVGPQVHRKRIHLKTRLAAAPHQASIDRDLCHQAMLNLLCRAIKCTPDEGSILVETMVNVAAKKIIARISDSGSGISPKDLALVFDKFCKAGSNVCDTCGSEFDLSLVRHIIESVHGGRISVESGIGQGSTFTFELDISA